jgi:ribosomal protein S7
MQTATVLKFVRAVEEVMPRNYVVRFAIGGVRSERAYANEADRDSKAAELITAGYGVTLARVKS